MAKNYIKPGDHQTFTAAADTASGAGVLLGTLLGVSLTTVASGANGEAGLTGVWELPKLSTAVIAAWDRPSWDVSAGQFIATGEAAGDLLGGAVAVEAAGSGTTTVKVMLRPGAGSRPAA
jgi:predicted RecA/RadA family phage recombinase